MELTPKNLEKFADYLSDRLEKVKNKIIEGSGVWDTRLRNNFQQFVKKWFCEYFEITEEQSKEFFYVEGRHTIPEVYRKNLFFGSPVNPDAAFILPNKIKIAIELDHGTKGSQIKMALLKASFSVIMKQFDSSILFFFLHDTHPKDNFKIEKEKQILDFFKEKFKTKLYII